MSEVKMSDVFPEGYKLTFDYCPSYTGVEDTFGFIFLSSQPCVFICDAVNNYDRLQQENAELREFAKYCQGFLGCEETRDPMALHGITIKAKELLNK